MTDFTGFSESRKETGIRGEQEAVEFLKALGYEILEQSYRAGRYECDIIARIADTVVFTEVKTLNRSGLPELKIDAAKQKSMIKVALHYCKKHSHSASIRFDVVSIVFLPFGKRIMHFSDVFYPMQTGI